MALLEFLAAATRARIVTPDILQGVTRWRLGLMMVLTVRTVNMTGGIVAVRFIVMRIVAVVVLTVRTMDMGL